MKADSKKSTAAADKAAAPMDIEETPTLEGSQIAGKRRCYAMDTLVKEVLSADDGVQVYSTDPDEYGVDLTVTLVGANETLIEILLTLEPDIEPRINEIHETGDADVVVTFENQAFLKDDRTPFGIDAAHEVATEDKA